MIDAVTNADAIPVLEQLLRFAGRRHRLVVNNIANLSTPGFVPTDLSVSDFQARLARAVDERRDRRGGLGGGLGPVAGGPDDPLAVAAEPKHENILFHDRNDRDLERTMQDLAENFMTFRLAAQLVRSRLDLVNTAIRERI